MGQKSKQASPDVNLKLASMMVPIDLLNFFDIHQVHEKPNEWQIVLVEKEHLIPQSLKGIEDVVLDGYCNPLNILSHCFSTKPIYLVLKRRRWKQSNSNKHYSNEYKICDTPAKLTPPMAGFLKI